MLEETIRAYMSMGENNLLLTLTFFTTVMVLYAVFVFYFYRFLAKKNILELNLNQYNQYENATLVKIFAGIFYVIEYIILLPIMTLFWFSILSILTLVLAESLSVSTVLLITTALVASVRISSFISEDLSKDLAKMLPFTLLAIAITNAGFFDIQLFLERINEIPSLFSNILYYLIFIMTVEVIMRIIEFFHSLILGAYSINSDAFEEKSETE